jgi:hypothetical protein
MINFTMMRIHDPNLAHDGRAKLAEPGNAGTTAQQASPYHFFGRDPAVAGQTVDLPGRPAVRPLPPKRPGFQRDLVRAP